MTRGTGRGTAYLAFATICLVWGTTYTAIKVALESIPPFLMGGLRYVTAGLVLMAILAALRRPLPASAAWRPALISGTLLLGVGNGGVIWAEQWVASGLAAVVIAATPFWMVGVEALSPAGERLTRRAGTGLLLGFAGIVLLVWPAITAHHSGWGFATGVAALQLASMGWALGTAYTRRQASRTHPFAAAAAQMTAGGAVMLALGTLAGEWGTLSFTGRTTTALVYLIVMGSLIGFVAYVYALSRLPTSFVSLYAYVNPVVAVAMGTMILGEPIGWRLIASVAIILTGMAIVSASPSRATRVTASAPRPISMSRDGNPAEDVSAA